MKYQSRNGIKSINLCCGLLPVYALQVFFQANSGPVTAPIQFPVLLSDLLCEFHGLISL